MTDARKRALRAARVVTLGLVLATPGCYAGHGGLAGDSGTRPVVEDAALAQDAGGAQDAGAPWVDAGTDAAVADAGICTPGEDWAACCERIGWDWNRGCAAWGPFVPPGEVA